MANFSSRLILAAWCGLFALAAMAPIALASGPGHDWSRYCRDRGDHKADCIRAARDYGLNGSAIARACEKATACSSDCIRAAWDYDLRGELMVHACDDQPVEATAPCIRTGWHEGIRGAPLARLCRSVRKDVTDCIRSAVGAGMTVEEVVTTCGGNHDGGQGRSVAELFLDNAPVDDAR
jgi:hypothetical protein